MITRGGIMTEAKWKSKEENSPYQEKASRAQISLAAIN
jgi:hypothetical protein